MQHTTLLQLLAALLVIVNLGWPVLAFRLARSARSVGFDEGHEIAHTAAQDRIGLLNQDLCELARKRANEQARHQLERDQLLQDADQRIAAYARRSNPFNERDLSVLAGTVKSLELARDTFTGLQALDKQAETKAQLSATRGMHDRLQEVLNAQAQPTGARELEAVA